MRWALTWPRGAHGGSSDWHARRPAQSWRGPSGPSFPGLHSLAVAGSWGPSSRGRPGSSIGGSSIPGLRASSVRASTAPGLRASSVRASTASGLLPASPSVLGVRGLSPASARLRPLQALSPGLGRRKRLALTQGTPSLLLDCIPDVFSLRVLLEESGELFRVPNCRASMTVRELKEQLDLVAGIPFNLQRLQYLDQGILMDESTLKFHDVAPGGVISLCIWHYGGWTELVLAAVEGDPNKLSCLGVSSEDSATQAAHRQHLGEEEWKCWVEQRAFVALYITSHRGHLSAVKYLLEHGANCMGRTPLGRTPLHVAAAMGRLKCILLLLRHGASINQKDKRGETPMSLAHSHDRHHAQRRMYLFYWVSKGRGWRPSVSAAPQKGHPKPTPKKRQP